MKKKIFASLAAAALMLSLCACGGTTTDSQDGTDTADAAGTEETIYKVGDTWTVDGQWSLTINSVEEVSERNEFADKQPAAVYMINYTYTNDGYEDSLGIMNGLYLALDGMRIIDSAGTMGYSYPGNVVDNPQETPVGANCKAQACIGVDNAGSFQLIVDQYDGNGGEQSATFQLDAQ